MKNIYGPEPFELLLWSQQVTASPNYPGNASFLCRRVFGKSEKFPLVLVPSYPDAAAGSAAADASAAAHGFLALVW